MSRTTTGTTRSTQVGRTLALAVAAPLAVAALVTGASASTDEPPEETTWNTMEHEARRSLAEARQEQDRVLNPSEHEGYRPSPPDGPAGRATIAGTCAEALSQAWEDLGHFSDGMETYMLGTSICSTR